MRESLEDQLLKGDIEQIFNPMLMFINVMVDSKNAMCLVGSDFEFHWHSDLYNLFGE